MKCQLWFNWRGCASSWETFVTRNIFIFIGWCIVFVFLFGYFFYVVDMRLETRCAVVLYLYVCV